MKTPVGISFAQEWVNAGSIICFTATWGNLLHSRYYPKNIMTSSILPKNGDGTTSPPATHHSRTTGVRRALSRIIGDGIAYAAITGALQATVGRASFHRRIARPGQASRALQALALFANRA